VTTAAALGVHSARATWFALRVCRALAALAGAGVAGEGDAATAARLVLAPRATRLPASPQDEADEPAEAEPPPPADPTAANDAPAPPPQALDEAADVVLAAARAAIPAGLLAQLQIGLQRRPQRGAAGRAGATRGGASRGRPVGVRAGLPERGARLDLVETLRAAAPWQPVRRRAASAATGAAARHVRIEATDFRIRRFKERSETTTIFAVDASGSSALHRLAEAKGAVELLLADCYVRRDRVAVVAFRGRGAEVLLPPTRSLVRAKRSLAGLPGGGGTPLAAGLDAALSIADAVQRRGGTAVLVILTDGRANIARDAAPGRGQAEADALQAARGVRAAGLTALLIDTSPRPQAFAAQLAGEMDARYLPLPHADAKTLNRAVRVAATGSP
jgi:magnesium chelatase subunit D